MSHKISGLPPVSGRYSALKSGVSNLRKEKMKLNRSTPHIDACEQDFEQTVLNSSLRQPVLVDFWAEWCAPCLALAPALERAVAEYPQPLQLVKVEVDDNMRLAGRYRLRGFPTVILFQHGDELGRFAGAHPTHWISDWLRRQITSD